MNINRTICIGHLTADPEIKTLPSGQTVCTFSVALNESYKKGADVVEHVSYINCTAFGKLGETVTRYCQKGKQIAVEGRLRQERWQTQEGKSSSRVVVVVDSVQFLGARNGQEEPHQVAQSMGPGVGQSEDIPF